MEPGSLVGDDALRADVAELEWYHTLELAPGVVTPGWLDTRPVASAVPFPASLEGKRCLDVATGNGFWAFEMERRGAAEVIGIDVLDPPAWDWPVASDPATIEAIGARLAAGRGFEIAKRALDSSVERVERSVYDLNPEEFGRFDVVYLGSLLVHLRDPVGALERVRSVCGGTLVVVDGIDLPLALTRRATPVARLYGDGRPWWWYCNDAGLARMVEAAGFKVIAAPKRIWIPPGPGQPVKRLRLRALRWRWGRDSLVAAWKGDPHAALVAQPATA